MLLTYFITLNGTANLILDLGNTCTPYLVMITWTGGSEKPDQTSLQQMCIYCSR
jgi:hypothetical protein